MPLTTPDDLLLLSAQNAELRTLLEETLQYLMRLPPVPVTIAFARRLEHVVTQTSQVRARQVADSMLEEAIRDVTWLSASAYMGNGVPLFGAVLEGRRLTLSSRGVKDGYPEAVDELVKRIGSDGGMVIDMEPSQPRRR